MNGIDPVYFFLIFNDIKAWPETNQGGNFFN